MKRLMSSVCGSDLSVYPSACIHDIHGKGEIADFTVSVEFVFASFLTMLQRRRRGGV